MGNTKRNHPVIIPIILLSIFGISSAGLTAAVSSPITSTGRQSGASGQNRLFFTDEFNYPSISAMVAAGWTVCGNAPSSYYGVAGGYLTLQNDGSVAAWMCRNLVANGVHDWNVSDRAAAVGGSYASFQLNAFTVGHQWTVQADGYYSTLILARDQIHVLQVPGYFPQFGVYHVVSMEMRNGVISMFLDGKLFGSFTAGQTGSAITGVAMGASWTATDNYDYVTAASL